MSVAIPTQPISTAEVSTIVFGTDQMPEKSYTFDCLDVRPKEMLYIKPFIEQAEQCEIVRACTQMMEETGDTSIVNHGVRVAWASAILCNRAGINPNGILLVIKSALCHDVGRITPEIRAITESPVRFVGAERKRLMQIVEHHSVLGAEIVQDISKEEQDAKAIAEIVGGHHAYSRQNPYGPFPLLNPQDAEKVAFADELDALATVRPYKPAFTKGSTRQILGHQFNGDPRIRTIDLCFDY